MNKVDYYGLWGLQSGITRFP